MRQTIDNSRSSFSSSADSDKSLTDYFGKFYSFDSVKGNPIFLAFNTKIREVNNICRSILLDIGMAQVMCGKYWVDIKYGNFDNLIQWLLNNNRRVTEITNLKMHNDCMKTEAYKKWFERGIVD